MLLVAACAFLISNIGLANESGSDSIAHDATSDSTRSIRIDHIGLSLDVPAGWEVLENYPNTTLVIQPPFTEGMGYQRTIQLLTFPGGQVIGPDEVTRFETFISTSFSRSSSSLEAYRIRNHALVTLPSGHPALVLYAEFLLDNVEMMQMHLVFSSANSHFLTTFTDLAAHFESSAGRQDYLGEAWSVMTSIQLDQAPPRAISSTEWFLVGCIVLGALSVFLAWSIRRRHLISKRYESIQGEEVPEHEIKAWRDEDDVWSLQTRQESASADGEADFSDDTHDGSVDRAS